MRGVGIAGEVGSCRWGRGKMGWTSLPLLKKTTAMKKGRGRRGVAFKVKDQVRPAPLVLTLTDEQAALVAPESNQLLHLHLGKRYYAEALDFMRMVEGACACSFLASLFLPAFTLTLTAFLWKEKMLTRFLF